DILLSLVCLHRWSTEASKADHASSDISSYRKTSFFIAVC
ncbi:16258_t:CDS:1, partial [Funneliformis caledonium]